MFSYQNKPRLSFKNTQMVSGITQIFTFLWSLVQQSLGLVFSSSQCQLVESCEGQRWILACYTIRLRQSEKEPLSAPKEWQPKVGKAQHTHKRTHTRTSGPRLLTSTNEYAHAQTHTDTHNLPLSYIDVCIQKHTCQGLSTVWAKAKKSAPPLLCFSVCGIPCL